LELVKFEDAYKQLEHVSPGYEEGAMREVVFEYEVKKFLAQLEEDEYAEIEEGHEEEDECREICAHLLAMLRKEECKQAKVNDVMSRVRNSSNEMERRQWELASGSNELEEEMAKHAEVSRDEEISRFG
jgi:hypothetical protein